MYSHRIVAFFLFTSLFFISSSIFAGLAWLIFSFHPSAHTPAKDHTQKDQSQTVTDKRTGNDIKDEHEPDDDLTLSHSITAHTSPDRLSHIAVTESYPPVTELSAKEEARQGLRGSWRTESSISEVGDDDVSSITNFKEESISGDTQDNDIETIERSRVSKRNL
jgi:hypothetical protein